VKVTILGSGSRGNSTIVQSNYGSFLIDIGFYYRDLISRIRHIGVSENNIKGVFITHEHRDHVKGLGNFLKRHNILVYMSGGTFFSLPKGIKSVVQENVHLLENAAVNILDFTIEGFTISHDAREPLGFQINQGKSKLSYITDMGIIEEHIIEKLQDSSGIILEANHDIDMLWNGGYPEILKQRIAGPYGHLSNDQASELLKYVISEKLKYVYLAHVSQENNSPQCALSVINKAVNGNKMSSSTPIIRIADQNFPAETFEI